MYQPVPLQDIVQQLRKDISLLEEYRNSNYDKSVKTGLGIIEKAFSGHVFPTGVVHEFISPLPEHAAATNGFVAGLLGHLMQHTGMCVWVGTKRTLFPATLNHFGIIPERIIFVDLSREKEALWTIEEALKCDSLAAVVGELRELSFTESRRLQLAVEQSHVTGFIHRHQPRSENIVACTTRWKIRPLPSYLENDMIGVGFPRWNVQLTKVRNGVPGSWNIGWQNGNFRHIMQQLSVPLLQKRKAG